MRDIPGALGPENGPDRVGDAVRAFEEEWRRGGPAPSLERHRAAQGPGAPIEVLAALVKSDLRWRYSRGERPSVADYLARFPALRGLRDRVVSLVYEEYCLREERGEAPDPDRFCERYEPWRDSLESQLRYHRLLSQVAGVSAPKPRFPDPGEHFARKFRLGPVLGRGGDAQVYIAHEEELGDRRVALKIAPDRGREPSILGQLEHPNIVGVLSVCREEDRGLRGISMPYRPGQPLHEIIRRIDPGANAPRSARVLWEASAPEGTPATLPPRSAVPGWDGFPWKGSYVDGVAWVILTLARALGHAHARAVLHCDVKPANILLTVKDGPQLLDFNLAHDPHAADQADAALHGGTLPYMAPEQLRAFLDPARRREVGPRSDLYALGLVLVEMLTGRHPEAHDPDLPLTRAIGELLDRRSLKPASLRSQVRGVPHALDAIAARCLAAEPSDRYEHAGELAEDLQRFLGRRPARHAPNPSRRERLGLWLRRNWIAVTMGVVLLALAPIGLHLAELAWLKHRVETHPNSASARIDLGMAYERVGMSSDAREQYHLAEKLEDAAEALGRGVRARPDSAALWTSLGLVQIDNKPPEWEDARRAFQRALSLDPGLYVPHHGLAKIAEVHDRSPEDAVRHMTDAVRAVEAATFGGKDAKLAKFRQNRAVCLITLAGKIREAGRSEAGGRSNAGELLEDALEELRRVRYAWDVQFHREGKQVDHLIKAGLEFQTANAEMLLGDFASDREEFDEALVAYREGWNALRRADLLSDHTPRFVELDSLVIEMSERLRERIARDTPRLWRLIFGDATTGG